MLLKSVARCRSWARSACIRLRADIRRNPRFGLHFWINIIILETDRCAALRYDILSRVRFTDILARWPLVRRPGRLRPETSISAGQGGGSKNPSESSGLQRSFFDIADGKG